MVWHAFIKNMNIRHRYALGILRCVRAKEIRKVLTIGLIYHKYAHNTTKREVLL